MILDRSHVVLHHPSLNTSFHGVEPTVSSPDLSIHQFRGIKYAIVPARFRQSVLCSSYPPVVDATKFGPICPQPHQKSLEEELIGIPDTDIPRQVLVQDEFDCLNLNITAPTHQSSLSRFPVMVWVHGGGNHGCGSSWVYDGGPLVATSIRIGKPIILVTFNYRLGFFGCAASSKIAEDNRAAGDQGVGNYGLRDQRRALEWVNQYIAGFGGDPSNVTIFGSGTGAADIIGHLYSNPNKSDPLFARAIVQSAIVEHNVPDVATAGWLLSRALCTLRVSTLDQLRNVRAEALAEIHCPLRAVDDCVFFRVGWRESLFPPAETEDTDAPMHQSLAALRLGVRKGKSKSRSPHPQGRVAPPPAISGLQPLIIGDSACDSDLWNTQASGWAASGVVRRLRAICQSLNKATALLNAYDITPNTTYELSDRVLELVQDARIAWPTECVAQAAKKSGRQVYRYVFDQEGPARGVPHHVADLIYLFDNVPLPLSPAASPMSFEADEPLPSLSTPQSSNGDVADMISRTRTLGDIEMMDEIEFGDDRCLPRPSGGWPRPVVDEWSYGRVRDTIQSRWITFAWGERPWDGSRGKVFVFGPEGETGERSASVFEGRRRRKIWEEVLRPLGVTLVHKVGQELSNGPGSR
ncbi:Alpha/Beta hydrolase protein [Boletus edulis]|nr:Alpha/Beta hydrolase protein [Boletus edulis]